MTQQEIHERRKQTFLMFYKLCTAGYSASEIARQYNFSRKYVQQVLQRHSSEGFHYSLKELKRHHSEKCGKKEYLSQHLKQYRCSRGCAIYLTGYNKTYKSPIAKAYLTQRRTAKTRGIEFLVSLPEWCRIWRDSGHWHERGRGRGKYVMARYEDKGAYKIGNVEIILSTKNNSDAARYKTWGRRLLQNVNSCELKERQV
jgi:predicted DNA-binding protein YlxM (UPF0122 family)